MENHLTLQQVTQLLKTARSPRDLFGTTADDIEAKLREFKVACHPDRHGDSASNHAEAERLYKLVQEWAELAKQPPIKLKSPKREYELLRLLAVGDVADVHLATALTKEGPKDYIVKIGRVREAAALLATEQQIVAKLLKEAGDLHYRKFFPTLAESFPASDKFQKRVNIFLAESRLFTLEEVAAKHKRLDGRHLAWIFKRLLTAIGFAHKCGLVHGAVLPCHVLVSPDDHGIRLVGWSQAVEAGKQIKFVSTKYKAWYPPEVLKKQPVSTGSTDIYMAAQCVLSLASADYAGGGAFPAIAPAGVPPIIWRFLRTCMLEGPNMRPGDALLLYDEFSDVLRVAYGPPKFQVLDMD